MTIKEADKQAVSDLPINSFMTKLRRRVPYGYL